MTSDPFLQALETSRTIGEHRLEGCGYVTGHPLTRALDGVSVWGPPAGNDGYRERNIQWTRQQMVALKADRVLAVRDGRTREVYVIDGWLDTYRRSLADAS